MADQVFVARERVLARLNDFLFNAIAGQGHVVFVTGEAGAGKTALVTEFARRSQSDHSDLLVAIGQGDAHTGIGDPYLPFREVLGMLTGDVEARLSQGAITQENARRLRDFLQMSGQALVDFGPDLIDIFVPGAGLATRAGTFLAGKALSRGEARGIGWLDRLHELSAQKARQRAPGAPAGGVDSGLQQDHIFEQYTHVLQAMAAEQPLVVVLDDLQWTDRASLSLLFRLGRRIVHSPILILGAFRPEEVALGRDGDRHPLEKVLAESKRYYGDICIDLDAAKQLEGQRLINALLDTEPNRLVQGFRDRLHAHTGGHPLFTVELLRTMQERGDLLQDGDGNWIEGPDLDWDALPARVEGVIEERIGRLEDELRQTLTVASVEGDDFTAQVVARVRQADERGLVPRISRELDRKHRLVGAQGVRRVDSQHLSLFRFRHHLFRKYLYDHLNEVERAYLHEDVGRGLEDLYGTEADEIAVQLARHSKEAELEDKARHYLRRAGEQAAAGAAHAAAAEYLSRALALTPEDDLAERYALLSAREEVYGLQGSREVQSRDLQALARLAEELGMPHGRPRLNCAGGVRRWTCRTMRGPPPQHRRRLSTPRPPGTGRGSLPRGGCGRRRCGGRGSTRRRRRCSGRRWSWPGRQGRAKRRPPACATWV